MAWHERLVGGHLEHLEQVASEGGPPLDRLRRVLGHVAGGHRRRHDVELSAFLHGGAHLDPVRDRLTGVVAGLIEEAVVAGEARDDPSPTELAVFCIHAMSAAAALSSQAAVRRLVAVALDGLRRR